MEQTTILYYAIVAILGIGIGYAVRHTAISKQTRSIEQKIKKELEDSQSKAKGIVLRAQEKAAQILEDIKQEEKERTRKLNDIETHLLKKENTIEKERSEIKSKEEEITNTIKKATEAKEQVEKAKEKILKELENVAGMTSEMAKETLFQNVEKKYKDDLVQYSKKIMNERREEIEKKTTEIISSVLQKYSRAYVSDLTTTAVDIPNEDYKGKIIGKEGRNIRAFEKAAGVELIIDETPDSIIISSFDPVRRAVAKKALEDLIKDGRIQPAKIEEKVETAKQEISKTMFEQGEAAAHDVGIYDLPKEIIQLLGRLYFRTSYGQNVLQHSVEVTHFAGMLAAELGVDVETAKRGALLHDIGKSVDHEIEGSHVDIGVKILKKYGIGENVIKAMQAHHEEYPYLTPESFVVASADILSASRPGARRDTLENYIKRLTDLENIANQFEGVKQSYAIAAGRELRVFVIPEKIDDWRALEMAREIAKNIESELKYPGEIKVIVIRETRAVEYAK